MLTFLNWDLLSTKISAKKFLVKTNFRNFAQSAKCTIINGERKLVFLQFSKLAFGKEKFLLSLEWAGLMGGDAEASSSDFFQSSPQGPWLITDICGLSSRVGPASDRN